MRLDNQTLELIAVGASVAANCQPCLEFNVAKALQYGAEGEHVAEAIEVGRKVRQGAASKLDKFTLSLKDTAPSSANGADAGCSCIS